MDPSPPRDPLLMVRWGRVNLKFRRSRVAKLPLLRDVLEACEASRARSLDLGSSPPDGGEDWLAIARAWSDVPPEEYVLPPDGASAGAVRSALQFFGVDAEAVAALRSAAALRRENARLKADAEHLEACYARAKQRLGEAMQLLDDQLEKIESMRRN